MSTTPRDPQAEKEAMLASIFENLPGIESISFADPDGDRPTVTYHRPRGHRSDRKRRAR